jgi:rod shape determining protein RodA
MSMFLEEGYEKRQFKLTEKLMLINWPFLLLIATITSFGVAALYSVAGGALEPWASRHVVRFCLGLALLFAVAVSDIRWWLRAAYPLYLVALVLLALVMVIGVESGGAKRWLGYGELSFQPSEMMKIALILALARYYQWLPPEKVSWPHALLIPLAMIGAPVLLALAQPDLGTAMLFAVVGSGLLFLAGVSWIYYLGGIVGVIVVLPHIWERLHDYQKERVLTFIDPERDPLGSGYHILQSKIAIGSGGLMGKGFMQGTQAQLNFLPEKHTDFIFTMFAEEMGFIGAVCLLALYLLVLLFITYMALRCRSTFARLVAAGMGLCLFAYVFINVAMVTGLVPVVCVPLPLVS